MGEGSGSTRQQGVVNREQALCCFDQSKGFAVFSRLQNIPCLHAKLAWVDAIRIVCIIEINLTFPKTVVFGTFAIATANSSLIHDA